MKKITIIFIVCILLNTASFATIRIVDINGGGQYTTIQAGINAASNNDTVLVWPGTYQEQIALSKNITLMGSGYENTIITGNFNPTVIISQGKLQWFLISSLMGDGISISGGIVTNCVVKSCAHFGIACSSGSGIINNCVIANNAHWGVWTNRTLNITNCISYYNTGGGYYYYNCTLYLLYSNGSCGNYYGSLVKQGNINIDPAFPSTDDYHVTQGTPCWDTGHPSLKDPDGTRSDMGYFGGPDAPIYPVVYEITTSPNGNNINIQAKARANY